MELKTLVVLPLLLAVHALASAASFNCAKATTFVEKRICANSTLGKLDENMANLFKNANSRPYDQTLADQRSWLKEVALCKDDACIQKKYEERIAALREFIQQDDKQISDKKKLAETRATAPTPAAAPPTAQTPRTDTPKSSSHEVFEYVSRNLWTVWGGVCKQKPAYLSATYSLDAGQRLFRNGQQFQDMNPNTRRNASFEYSFDVPQGFKYRQILRHVSDNRVVVTDLIETITLVSKDKMQVASESLDLDLEQFGRDGNKRYLKKRESRIETLCNP